MMRDGSAPLDMRRTLGSCSEICSSPSVVSHAQLPGLLCDPWRDRQASAVTDSSERLRKITDQGVIPAPSGAGALVLHAGEGQDCLVMVGVFRPADKAQQTAIVTLVHCMQSVFGYPNDEAYWHDPRGVAGDRPGYGFFEVLSSTWPERLIAYNRHAFPDRTPSHYAAMRHFFIGCHDASGEFLAADIRIELADGTYDDAVREALTRAIGWPSGR